MSTYDVPGSKAANRDVLVMGAWAEADDGSLIFIEGTEAGSVVVSHHEPIIQIRGLALTEKDAFTLPE